MKRKECASTEIDVKRKARKSSHLDAVGPSAPENTHFRSTYDKEWYDGNFGENMFYVMENENKHFFSYKSRISIDVNAKRLS